MSYKSFLGAQGKAPNCYYLKRDTYPKGYISVESLICKVNYNRLYYKLPLLQKVSRNKVL